MPEGPEWDTFNDTLLWLKDVYSKQTQQDCYKDMQIEAKLFQDWATGSLSVEDTKKITKQIRDKIATNPKFDKLRSERAKNAEPLVPQSRVGDSKDRPIVLEDSSDGKDTTAKKCEQCMDSGSHRRHTCEKAQPGRQNKRKKRLPGPEAVAANGQSANATSKVHQPSSHGPARQKLKPNVLVVPREIPEATSETGTKISIAEATRRLHTQRRRTEILHD
jgi:hypothetical protein